MKGRKCENLDLMFSNIITSILKEFYSLILDIKVFTMVVLLALWFVFFITGLVVDKDKYLDMALGIAISNLAIQIGLYFVSKYHMKNLITLQEEEDDD